MVTITIDKLRKYITSNSTQYGGDFGEMNNIPTIKEENVLYTRDCQNCAGHKILFEHMIDLSAGTCKYSKKSAYHIGDDILSNSFRIHGYICPICDDCEIILDNPNKKYKG